MIDSYIIFPDNHHLIWEQKEKGLEILEYLL